MWILPRRPRAGHLDGEHVVRLAQPLCAGLVDAGVAAGRFDHRPALGDRHARRLLRVDVLAGPHRQDRRQGVPAVARGDQHGVDVRPLGQEAVDLGIHRAVVVVVTVVNVALHRQPPFLLQVADGDELHLRLAHDPIQIVHPAALDADAANENSFAGRRGAVLSERSSGDELRHGRQSAGPGRRLEKSPTGDGHRIGHV